MSASGVSNGSEGGSGGALHLWLQCSEVCLYAGDVFGVGALLSVERATIGGELSSPDFVVAGGQSGQRSGSIGVASAGAAARLAWLRGELRARAIGAKEDGAVFAALEMDAARAKCQRGASAFFAIGRFENGAPFLFIPQGDARESDQALYLRCIYLLNKRSQIKDQLCPLGDQPGAGFNNPLAAVGGEQGLGGKIEQG